MACEECHRVCGYRSREASLRVNGSYHWRGRSGRFYLAELLLAKGYTVHGVIRRASTFNAHRIDQLYRDSHEEGTRFFLHHGDLSNSSRMLALLEKTAPDEIYHLAAQSHVRVSFEEREFTGDVTGLGTVRLLEAIRMTGLHCRFYQASSSEMFGSFPPPQMRTPHSIRARRMVSLSCTYTGSPATIGRRMGSTLSTEFYSTTNLPAGEKRL